MRLPRTGSVHRAMLSSMLFPALIAAVGNLDCSNIITDGKPWDLSKLGDPRSVMISEPTPPTIRNTTYTIDICQNLPRSGSGKEEECPGGTRVCAIEHTIKPDDGTDEITEVIPIAGDLRNHKGGSLDAKVTRLKTADSEKEGLLIELNGGVYASRNQKAVIEFICYPERTGLETDFEPEDNDKDDSEKPNEWVPSLHFVSYEKNVPDTDTDILKLEWFTKYACEKQKDEDDAANRGHWGFFTWFLIIAFLVTAAYLIFGSWLNYNRYGARGWDLLPHGDSIRDIPYMLKDWTRRVLNTVQGGGSRGGYSAV